MVYLSRFLVDDRPFPRHLPDEGLMGRFYNLHCVLRRGFFEEVIVGNETGRVVFVDDERPVSIQELPVGVPQRVLVPPLTLLPRFVPG